jgi:hypothetical protein
VLKIWTYYLRHTTTTLLAALSTEWKRKINVLWVMVAAVITYAVRRCMLFSDVESDQYCNLVC